MFVGAFYCHLLFLLLPCPLYTNGLHDELAGLSPPPDQPDSSTGNKPHGSLSSTDAYSALPDVRTVDDAPWGI